MKTIVLGTSNIKCDQNAFGALAIQRLLMQDAIDLIQQAYNNGFCFFNTARFYTDSEEKIGIALKNIKRKSFYIATKTKAETPATFWKDLNTSLNYLKTDYVDLYQFQCTNKIYKPNDGTGMYECMMKAKDDGFIHHIGLSTHNLKIAKNAIISGLYETIQYPLSYLSGKEELELISLCKNYNVGFIATKIRNDGLLPQMDLSIAYMSQFDNVLCVWDIQRESELNTLLDLTKKIPVLDDDKKDRIHKEVIKFTNHFCHGCKECLPCPKNIKIDTCLRSMLSYKRANEIEPDIKNEMMKIKECVHCNLCRIRCPYDLDVPEMLKQNLKQYLNASGGNEDKNEL